MQPEFASAQGTMAPDAQPVNPWGDKPQLSGLALAGVVATHLGVFAALMSFQTVPAPVQSTALIVSVIRAAAVEPKAPAVTPAQPHITPTQPKPQLVQSRPQQPVASPVLATENLHPVSSSEVASVDKPVAQPHIQTPTLPAAPGVNTPTAPRFDADYLDNPAPNYPPLSRRAGEEGKVVLKVFVEPTGLASRIEVRNSSGYERLDKSAATAVGRWKFVPAKQGTDAVGAWVLVPIVFSLKV